MSELTVTIRDARRSICGHAPGIVADQLVAALSADPDTIEELQAAVMRFVPSDESSAVVQFRPGEDDTPSDAGVCIIDPVARYILWDTTYSSLEHCAAIDYVDHARNSTVGLPFHLADEWMIDFEIDSWKAKAEERRGQRQAMPPIDARAVLYESLAPFVAEQCFAARLTIESDGPWMTPAGWTLQALPERAKPNTMPTADDAMAEIHARWLMTPRDELQGRTPRDILLAQREHIDFDLAHRSQQWTMLRQCPPGIETESAAFRLGGFGSHENLMYYDLVRHLLAVAWDSVVQRSQDPDFADLFQPDLSREELIEKLRQAQQEWFTVPCEDGMARITPAALIDLERHRIPYAGSGEECMIDCDCPMCQTMAEADFGPMFLHFDGCNNDDDFPFTTYLTREEWEAEQRRHEEFDRKFNEKQKLRAAGQLNDDDIVGLNDIPF